MGTCCSSAVEDIVPVSRKYEEPKALEPTTSLPAVVKQPSKSGLPLLAFASADHFGQMPKARRGHSLVTYCDYLMLYGGFSTNSQVFSDCRIMDLHTGEWMTLPPKGTVPTARCTHKAVVFEKDMYVYGIHSGECADVYSFNLEAEIWSRVTSWGDVPASRGGHSAVVWDTHLWVFAGETMQAVTNDLYSFNFISKRWKVVPHANPDFVVMPRRDHTAVMYEGRMYVYGGFNDVNERMDLLCFDTQSSEWSTVETKGPTPPHRGSHTASVWRHTMIIFGGMHENTHRNDLWLLDLNTYQWYELEYARCRSELSLLTPESLTCFTNADNLPDAQHDDGQPVYMADYMRGRIGLTARRAVCQQVCPNPQPFIPETVSQGQPVVPCGVCYHASEVWKDCLYLWGGGDENVNYSELYCMYLVPLDPWFPEKLPHHSHDVTPGNEASPIKTALRSNLRPGAPTPQRVKFADDADVVEAPSRPRRTNLRHAPSPVETVRPDGEVEGGELSNPRGVQDSALASLIHPAPVITVDAPKSPPVRKDPPNVMESSAMELNIAMSLGSGPGCSLMSEGLKNLILEVEQDLKAEGQGLSTLPNAASPNSESMARLSTPGISPVRGRRGSQLVETIDGLDAQTERPPSPIGDAAALNILMRPSKRRSSVEDPTNSRRGSAADSLGGNDGRQGSERGRRGSGGSGASSGDPSPAGGLTCPKPVLKGDSPALGAASPTGATEVSSLKSRAEALRKKREQAKIGEVRAR